MFFLSLYLLLIHFITIFCEINTQKTHYINNDFKNSLYYNEMKSLYNEYKDLIEEYNKINAIKDNIQELNKKNDEKYKSEEITLLSHSANSTFSEINNNIDYIEKTFKEYQSTLYTYFANEYLQEINKEYEKSEHIKLSLKDLYSYCILYGEYNKTLRLLDKKINIINKEEHDLEKSAKKINTDEAKTFTSFSSITSLQSEKKNIVTIIEKHINDLAAYLTKTILGKYTIQKKMLYLKKKITEQKINEKKNILEKYKKNLYINPIIYQKNKKKLLKIQKELLDKMNEYEKYLELKNNKTETANDIKKFEKELEIYFNQIKNKFDYQVYQNIIQNISSEIKNIELTELLTEVYLNKKNIDLLEGWNTLSKVEVSTNEINSALKNINQILIKNTNTENKNNLKICNEKIHIYINFLNRILQIQNNSDYIASIKNSIDILSKKKDSIKKLTNEINNIYYINNFLFDELKTKTFWARSEYSISLLKLNNFIPEMKLFFLELTEKFSITSQFFVEKVKHIHNYNISQMLYSFVLFIFLIMFSYGYKLIIYNLFLFIDSIEIQSYYTRKLSLFLHILSQLNIIFYMWLNLLFIFYLKLISIYYLDTLFYLFSIPFCMYFFYVIYMNIQIKDIYFNQENDTFFYKFRHFFINKIILYTIIFLFFFRQAVISLIYGSAHEIILAAQFILIQIQSIILLKKHFTQYITEVDFFNEHLKKFIYEYYQLFITLIVMLIVMSNPYVGYGYQVVYFVSRTTITLILFPIWNVIFDFFKKKSISVFFNFEDGEARNKINMAKLLYILFLVGIYLSTSFILIYVILNLWGYNINLQTITNIFHENLLPTKNIINNEEIPFLSINTLLKVVLYVIKGYMASYIINRFVCQKILNPIIIGQTMQNTIMILFKYIVICAFFIIGLCIAGLGSIINKLGALIIALSFALKEPVADFISYFIILIQCPIKVGDVVRIHREGSGGGEPEVTGIVRSINSRTTIIRQRNSQTILIPNSLILKRSICNWSYYKSGFVSTEDFIITIDRDCDIEIIKNILLKIVESYPAVIKNPSPLVRCESITPIGYDFLIRAYINPERAADQWDIASHLRVLIIKKLQSEKIKFGIPEYKIYMNKVIKNNEELNFQQE